MLSKTKIKNRLKRKTKEELVETISLAKKNPGWLAISGILSAPTRAQASINVGTIDEKAKAGDTVVVLGKVLSQGELSKKVKICALSISYSASEKLKDSKSEFSTIKDEIKKNPKAEGLNIIR